MILEEHKQTCDSKRCSRCQKIFARDVFDEHRTQCDYSRCPGCRKKGISPSQLAQHASECKSAGICSHCTRLISTKSWDKHAERCRERPESDDVDEPPLHMDSFQCGACEHPIRGTTIEQHCKNRHCVFFQAFL